MQVHVDLTVRQFLTELLRKVEERLGFTHLVIRGTSEGNEYIYWSFNSQIVIRRGLEHNGILVMDIVRTKPTLGSPGLDRVRRTIPSFLIEHHLNIVWE